MTIVVGVTCGHRFDIVTLTQSPAAGSADAFAGGAPLRASASSAAAAAAAAEKRAVDGVRRKALMSPPWVCPRFPRLQAPSEPQKLHGWVRARRVRCGGA